MSRRRMSRQSVNCALHQQHRFKEAEIMHDIVSPAGSWSSGGRTATST